MSKINKILKVVFIIMVLIITTLFISYLIPHSNEYKGWKNTETACEEYGGCSCYLIAYVAVKEYKQNHNLTDEEFPTYIILNNESPPIW